MGEAMRRLKEDKPRREMARDRKITIIAIIGVVVMLVVFVVLAVTRERIAYTEAHDMVSGIASTRGAVEKFLDKEPKSLEFTEAEQKRMDEFEAALTKTKDYIESLSASNVMKNAEISEAYEKVKAEYPKIEKMAAIWNDVKLLLDLTDENIAKLKDSESEKLAVLGEELSEYRAEMTNYHQIHDNGAKKDRLIEDYGKMHNIGAEFEKEYAEIKLDDILGMSRDDILQFYATIEELNNKLSEKV